MDEERASHHEWNTYGRPPRPAGDAIATDDAPSADGAKKHSKGPSLAAWQAFFDFLVVIVTAGIWKVSCGQLDAARGQQHLMDRQRLIMVRQARIADKQRELTVTAQRAWIVPDWKQTETRGYFSDQGVSVWVKNAGAAPTLNLYMRYKIVPDVTELPRGPCQEPDARPIYLPDQQIVASRESEPLPLLHTAPRATDLVAIVWLTYDDPYGTGRTTKFTFHAQRDTTSFEWSAMKKPPRYGRQGYSCDEVK